MGQDPHNCSSQLQLIVMVLYQYFIRSFNIITCIDLILLYISDG